GALRGGYVLINLCCICLLKLSSHWDDQRLSSSRLYPCLNGSFVVLSRIGVADRAFLLSPVRLRQQYVRIVKKLRPWQLGEGLHGQIVRSDSQGSCARGLFYSRAKICRELFQSITIPV